jgi:hypothetical protein
MVTGVRPHPGQLALRGQTVSHRASSRPDLMWNGPSSGRSDWRELNLGSRSWWGACLWLGEERQGVDRRTATLMYAGRDRKSSMRRTVPLTNYASGDPGRHWKHGGLPCSGGAPTLLAQLDHLRGGSDRVMPPSRPTGTPRARGRSRWPRRSWTPCGRRGGGTDHTCEAAPPMPGSRSPGRVLPGAGGSGW